MAPFNVLHQPLYLSVVAWTFWAVPAAAEAFTILAIVERPAPTESPTSGPVARPDVMAAAWREQVRATAAW